MNAIMKLGRDTYGAAGWWSVFVMLCATLAITAHPVGSFAEEARTVPAEFVSLAEFVPGIIVDVRYAGSDNFMGRPIDGYHARKALMLKVPALALMKVNERLIKKGYRLKVFDAYRPMRAEREMIRWAGEKAERLAYLREGYVPARVWPGRRVGHVCGNAVDLTLVDASGKEVDMGTAFDAFSRESWTMNARGKALENRLFLKIVMESQGFVNYEREWWHFTFPSYPSPARDFVIR